MKKVILAATAMVVAFAMSAQATELDNENTVTTEQFQLGKDLPKTVVVRVKAGTNQVEVLHTNKVLANDELTKTLVSTSSFVKMDVKAQMTSHELDQDSSSSSWYFCFPSYNYYYPAYYYYGYQYNYTSYYSYSYGGYNYSYYGWRYGCYGGYSSYGYGYCY